MEILSDALRQAAETHEDEVGAIIRGLGDDGLVAWCKRAIGRHEAMLISAKSCLEPKPIISRCVGHDDEMAVLELSKANGNWHNALVEVVTERRRKGEYIPSLWREYLFDVFLKIRKKPDGRGASSEAMRNDAICKIVEIIVMHTDLKATRNEATEGKRCAASVVSAALGKEYSTIEGIWKRHRNSAMHIGAASL